MSDEERGGLDRLREELERLVPGADLDESAAFLRSVLAHMPALCSAIAPDGRFLYVNRTIPGLTAQEVYGKTVFDFTAPAMHQAARDAMERVMRTRQPDGYVGVGPGKNGPASRYQNWLGPIVAHGEVVALTLITQDVSDEYAVQLQLEESEERLRMALEASGLGMWRANMHTGELVIDERLQAIYLTDRLEFEQGGFDKFLHPDDRDRVNAAATSAFEGGAPYQTENRILRGDGSVGWVAGTGAVVNDADGEPVTMIGTIQDITERRALEEKLLRAQKLEAVGQLTAGIAHNFNNMLASILPTLELIQDDVQPRNAELVVGAKEAARRAAEMVRELLLFAGRRPLSRKAIDVEPLLEHVLRLCRTTFDRAIRLDVHVEPDLPPIAVEAPQIEQALMNMLINARDALLDAEVSAAEVRVLVDVDDETKHVRIRVIDNGPGMPADVRDRVFEPFFTTKRVGRGTGLGLSTTYGIVREHDGELWCDSAPGRGTTFTVLLPAAEREVQPDVEEPVAAPVGRGTLLIVDDEAVVRSVVVRVLQDAGFQALDAADGAAALETLAANPDVRLVVLDLNMPGPPWREVVAAIRSDHADTKVLAYTGKLGQGELDGVDGVVEKPAEPHQLIEAIAKVLGG